MYDSVICTRRMGNLIPNPRSKPREPTREDHRPHGPFRLQGGKPWDEGLLHQSHRAGIRHRSHWRMRYCIVCLPASQSHPRPVADKAGKGAHRIFPLSVAVYPHIGPFVSRHIHIIRRTEYCGAKPVVLNRISTFGKPSALDRSNPHSISPLALSDLMTSEYSGNFIQCTPSPSHVRSETDANAYNQDISTTSAPFEPKKTYLAY